MTKLTPCPNCQRHYHVELAQIARGVSRWACPFCGHVADFADEQAAQPGTSEGAKTFWAALSAIAIVGGLFVAVHIADHAIEQLTA